MIGWLMSDWRMSDVGFESCLAVDRCGEQVQICDL